MRSTRTPSPPPPKAAADSDVSSNGSSSDDENTANHQARRSSVVAFASAVASTPLLSLRPEGEGDSLRRTTVSSRTRSASRSTTKRRLESVERSVPSTESKPSSGAAAQTHRGSAGLDSTSGATLFESPRSIRRSSRNSRNSAASRSSRQSPSSSATTKGSACLAREGIARLTHGGTNLDSLSPSALAVDDSQSSRDSGRYAMPSLSSAPSSQSQRQTESSSYESSSELSSRSSAEGMSLPSRLQSQVVAAMPSQHTLTQGTISSGSTTDASQTQGNSPTQDDYSSTCSSHRCSHLSAPPADLDPSAASAAGELAAPPLPPQPPSALFLPVALFASALPPPLAERPLSSQRSVGSSPSTDKADLVSLAAFGMPFSPPIQAPGAAQGAIRLGKEASSLKPSEVQKQTAAEGPPGVACVKPAAKFDEPRDEPPGASSDDSGSDDEAVPGAGGHRAKKGSKRKQPTKTIHHGPSALGSAQAGGGAYVDLRGNVAGQARSSGGEGSSGESSEASRDAAGDAYVSKWEAARRDRAAMQGGVVSQAEHTTLEVLLRWPAGAPLGLAQLALPAVVVRRYQHQRGIAEAHAWQVEALRAGGGGCWQRGDHLVYSAPTGGGKTLVAELLVLRRLFRGDACGTILWAVPLKVRPQKHTL